MGVSKKIYKCYSDIDSSSIALTVSNAQAYVQQTRNEQVNLFSIGYKGSKFYTFLYKLIGYVKSIKHCKKKVYCIT